MHGAEQLPSVDDNAPIPEYRREELGAVDVATRARMLGVDYEALKLAARRLRVASLVLIHIPLAVILGVGIGLVTDPSVLSFPEMLGPFLLGALSGMAAGLAAVLVPGFVMWAVIRRSPMVQHAVVGPLGGIAAATALWFAVHFNPEPIGVLGCAVGAALSGTFGEIPHLQVPRALRTNALGLQAVIRQYREMPPSHSLVGGRVRWIVASSAVGCVALGSTAVIFSNAPGWLIPVALILVLGSTAAALLTIRGRPRIGTWVGVGEALLLLAAAILVR